MKICLSCEIKFDSQLKSCPSCGFLPQVLDGFTAYAAGFSLDEAGFNASTFKHLASLEESNFWFTSRNKLIIWALGKYSTNRGSLLEIGCGTGFVLKGISDNFKEIDLHGSDIFTNGLEFASKRLPKVSLMQMDARKIPFYQEFDLLGAFDVLEHIVEDELVLYQMNGALKPGGTLIITVPQHLWLWSQVDKFACHQRRYSGKDLKEKLVRAGFEVQRSTSFVSLLLPIMLLTRFSKKKQSSNVKASDELQLPYFVNAALSVIMGFERILIKIGIDFTMGGSRMVVAKKMNPTYGTGDSCDEG